MQSNRRAFTLIELLVVIAIIAVLMAILMPALQRIKKQARNVVCHSNLHQWGLIWAMYTQEHNGYFPKEVLSWRALVKNYHKDDDQEITLCPVATKPYTDGAEAPFGAWEQNWGDPDLQPARRQPYASSYGINQYVYDADRVVGGRDLDEIWRTANVKNAAAVPCFGDCAITGATPNDHDLPPATPKDMSTRWGQGGGPNEIRRFCMDRHDGNLTMLFLDWSTRKVGLKELWTLRFHRIWNTSNAFTRAGGVQPTDWPQWMRLYKDY
jgi:prepilin-type N-terminal cleavage/methylation domain-containing protein